jgi:hypothetical protein
MEHDIVFLQRVIMGMIDAAVLVLDHEHGGERGGHALVQCGISPEGCSITVQPARARANRVRKIWRIVIASVAKQSTNKRRACGSDCFFLPRRVRNDG